MKDAIAGSSLGSKLHDVEGLIADVLGNNEATYEAV